LPPHERSWRHPSELGPRAHDDAVARSTSGNGLVLATGALAAVAIVVMVVTLTPTRSSSPTAMNATTIPAANVQLQDDDLAPRDSTARQAIARDELFAFTATPNAVSAAPVGQTDELEVASRLPGDNDEVVVLTSSHTYLVAWRDLDRIEPPDGALVITRTGDLVASFIGGTLRMLIDE